MSSDHDSVHVSSLGFGFSILLALCGLTGLTVWTARMDLGIFDTPVALAIAFTKMTLVILFFMHAKWSSKAVKLTAASGLVFLLFLFGFTLADYTTRPHDDPWSRLSITPGQIHPSDVVDHGHHGDHGGGGDHGKGGHH